MSTSLYYKPVPDDDIYLGYGLKFHIAQKYWGHDGSLGGEEVVVGRDELPYLRGVADGASDEDVKKEAEKLIQLIETYGDVFLSLKG